MDLNIKVRSHFSHGFINRGCLHCAILKVLHSFKEKRTRKSRDMQVFLQNVQNEIFKILKMCKTNMKLTRAVCWTNSKISKWDKNTKLVIFLFWHYCRSLWWCNYWRSLMLRNSNSWSHLKSTVQIQFFLHPCNPFLIVLRNNVLLCSM